MDTEKTTWRELLEVALTQPGKLHEAYRAFHNYSTGNQLLAIIQCGARGIAPGPISTYPGWKEKGRQVRKGQKAIALWMPISGKKTVSKTDDAGNEETAEVGYTRFVMRNNWFVLAQTDGKDYTPEPLPDWNEALALESLNIRKIDYEMPDGNCQGYAQAGRQVAINPLAVMPQKTMFHELAHVMLGHCDEGILSDSDRTPRNLREVEAESVALLVCESLGLPGAEYSRGYIQTWAGFREMPEASFPRIFKAADAIIKAGMAKRSEA